MEEIKNPIDRWRGKRLSELGTHSLIKIIQELSCMYHEKHKK